MKRWYGFIKKVRQGDKFLQDFGATVSYSLFQWFGKIKYHKN